jgi:predicted O-methyltransferase YrrM
MKPQSTFTRRQFLPRSLAAASLVALAGCAAPPSGRSAEGAGGSRVDRAKVEKLLSELEADSRRFISLSREDGRFLTLMTRAVRARRVLELGTGHGYATLCLGLALEETGGAVTTMEIMPDRVQLAKQHLQRVGLTECVTFKEGDAHDLVPGLAGPFDLILLNADKSGMLDYFQKLHPQKLAPGGLLLAYAAIKQREKMEDFLAAVKKAPDIEAVVLSVTMDDGFCVAGRRLM